MVRVGRLCVDRCVCHRRRAGYFLDRSGGEIRYFVGSREDGWLVINSSERMGLEQFEVAVRSYAALERYLYGTFGVDVRSRLRLPRLTFPRNLNPGYDVRNVEFENVSRQALIDPSGETVAIGWLNSGITDLAELSLYLAVSVADIQTSFQSPDGQPLFGLWQPRPVTKPEPAPARHLPEGVTESDVRELVDLIARDEYVNGVSEDVIAHRRSRQHPKPTIRRDESWTGFLYFFYVGQGYRESSGFRYGVGPAAQPVRVPFGVTDETEKQIRSTLARIRDAADLPREGSRNAAAIVYDRASGRGMAHFFYGPDAEKWQLSPDNADQIADQGLALLRQPQGR